ncbi:MAG: response regulator transcription factor [Phycisphaerae bacterium]|nr:response regulator transcription factor [Phycisphaerae bacterium]
MEQGTAILVVEDEPAIREGLVDFLEFHGFAVTAVEDGLQAERTVGAQRFDLILLDLMLPQISGEQLCARWRQQGLPTPIIMLTAKGLEQERIAGLDLGADDYVTKPFSLEELLARIKAVLRRTDPGRSVGQEFAFGPWQIDVAALKAACPKRQIEISPREAQIIQYFAANPNRVVGREELYEQVWHDQMTDLGTRTVDVHIAKLRAKIERDPADPRIITTVRGAGYRYDKADPPCTDG